MIGNIYDWLGNVNEIRKAPKLDLYESIKLPINCFRHHLAHQELRKTLLTLAI